MDKPFDKKPTFSTGNRMEGGLIKSLENSGGMYRPVLAAWLNVKNVTVENVKDLSPILTYEEELGKTLAPQTAAFILEHSSPVKVGKYNELVAKYNSLIGWQDKNQTLINKIIETAKEIEGLFANKKL